MKLDAPAFDSPRESSVLNQVMRLGELADEPKDTMFSNHEVMEEAHEMVLLKRTPTATE